MTHFHATELQMTGYSADPQLTAAIETSDRQYFQAGHMSYVVRLVDATIALFTEFQMRVRAADIAEVVYTAGQGFTFNSQQKEAA